MRTNQVAERMEHMNAGLASVYKRRPKAPPTRGRS